MEELIEKGDSYLKNEDYDNAIRCYLECLEIEDRIDIRFKLCYLYILTKDYEIAFYYFINCYLIDDDYVNIDYNLGIFLFSMLIKLPDEYLETVKNMDMSDIKILNTDIGYQDIDVQNNIRNLIMEQSFALIKDMLDKKVDFSSNMYNLVTKELINNIVEFQIEEYKYQLNLIKSEDYIGLKEYLESVGEIRKLSRANEYTLKLVNELINLKTNSKMIEKINFKTDSIVEAIDCKDYELALEISKKYCYRNLKDRNNDIFYLLLNEIVKELKIIEQANTIDILDMDLGNIMSLDSLESIQVEVDYNKTVDNLVKYLEENNLYDMYKEIDNFLSSINKLEYHFFIVDLIKLSELENDFKLDKVRSVLEKLSLDTFDFRVGEYINYFYISLDNSEYMKAQVCLDIIKNAWRLGQEFNVAFKLEIILNIYSKEKIDDNCLTEKILKLTNKNKRL